MRTLHKKDLTMEKEYKPRIPRKPLLFYLDIIEQHTHMRLGHLGDISKNGIMIITEKHVPFNSIKNISIQLPDFKEFAKKFIEVQVEIRWMKPDDNPNLYCIGCRFVNINPDDLPLIEQVQEALGF
jgi:c-di-GMP-binding flagellar brake protein YcgR